MVWVYVIAAVLIFILLKELIRLPTIGKYGERYVFITGCDTGFGHLLAKRLESLGFHVFAACYTERGADELRKVSSARIQTLLLDVTKTESIVKARDFVVKHLPTNKGLWALVNNAGIAANIAPSEMLTRADYDSCLAVNLYGVIDVTRTFQPLVRKDKGRIINISSVMGRIAAAGAPYVVSKYGVEAFTDVLRREVLNQSMTVHVVEPGFFQTEINLSYDFQKAYHMSYNHSIKDVQRYYGNDYVERDMSRIKPMIEKLVSTKTYLVVDAYTHAITAMFPRYRYLVGNDCKYYFRLLWNLPEWISDRILTSNVIIPEGARHT